MCFLETVDRLAVLILEAGEADGESEARTKKIEELTAELAKNSRWARLTETGTPLCACLLALAAAVGRDRERYSVDFPGGVSIEDLCGIRKIALGAEGLSFDEARRLNELG